MQFAERKYNMNRKQTRQVKAGNVLIGGGASIPVQSMLSTRSTDIPGSVAQARALVQQYCSQYNLSTSHVGLAGATAGIESFFQAWTNQL